MLRDRPILNILIWTAVGAFAASLLVLAYWTASPQREQNDAALDQQARKAGR